MISAIFPNLMKIESAANWLDREGIIMDLKLKDVAELLNVSEVTIRRWVTDS